MFKVNIKTPERRHRCRPGIFIAYLKHISHFSSASIVALNMYVFTDYCPENFQIAEF